MLAMAQFNGLSWLEQLVEEAAGADPVLSVRLMGRTAAVTAFRSGLSALPSGESLTRMGFGDSSNLPAGMMYGFIDVATGDGNVYVGVVPQSGNGFRSGTTQSVAILDPTLSTPTLMVLNIPTTSGLTAGTHNVNNTASVITEDPDHGGADTSDVSIITWVDGTGATRQAAVFSAVSPFTNKWKIHDESGWTTAPEFLRTGHGVFNTFVVITKTASGWAFDPDLSRSSEQLAVAANALGPTLFTSNTTPGWMTQDGHGESWYGSQGITELERFPNGQLVVSQYFQSSGSSASIFVLDVDPMGGAGSTNRKVVASYKFPDFYDVHGKPSGTAGAKPVSWACRSVTVDPTPIAPGVFRFFVLPDVFPAASRGITSVWRANNIATFNTAPVAPDTTTDHSYGAGQYPTITGLSGTVSGVDLATFNTPAGTSATNPITATPTGSSFSVFAAGPDLGSAGSPVACNGTVRLRQGAPCVEMKYDTTVTPPKITPVSLPCHTDPLQPAIGTALCDGDGNVFTNPLGTQAFFVGALSVWKKSGPKTALELRAPYAVVGRTDAQNLAAFAASFGTVVTPDVAFGATAGLGSFAGGMAFDPPDNTVYWTANDNLRRVKLTPSLAIPTIDRATDGGFEAGTTAFTGYFAGVTRVTTTGHSSSSSLQVTATGGTAPTAPNCTSTELFAVTPDAPYTVSGWVKAATGMTGMASIGIQWRDASGVGISNTYGTAVAVSDAGWVFVTATLNAPTHAPFESGRPAASGQITIKCEQMPGNGRFFLDDVTFLDQNRATNPGFELPGVPNAPTFVSTVASATTATRVTSTAHLGTASLQVTATSAVAPTAPSVTSSEAVPVTGGQSYAVRGWVKTAAGSGRASIGIRWLAANGTTADTQFGAPATVDDTGWVEVAAFLGATLKPPFQTPLNAVTGQIVVKVEQLPASGSFYLDDVSFTAAPGTSLSDVDLAVTELPHGGPATKNGGAIVSSRPTIDAGRRKLYIPVSQYEPSDRATDPSFEAGTITFTGYFATVTRLNPPTGVTPHSGTAVLQVATTPTGTSANCASSENLSVRPGDSYVVKGWVLVPAATTGSPATASIGLQWYEADGTTGISNTFGSPTTSVTDGATWTQVTATITAPTSVPFHPNPVAFGRLIVQVSGLPAGGKFYLDDVSVINATGAAVPPMVLDQYLYEITLPTV